MNYCPVEHSLIDIWQNTWRIGKYLELNETYVEAGEDGPCAAPVHTWSL
jgi:hypothetical protein